MASTYAAHTWSKCFIMWNLLNLDKALEKYSKNISGQQVRKRQIQGRITPFHLLEQVTVTHSPSGSLIHCCLIQCTEAKAAIILGE